MATYHLTLKVGAKGKAAPHFQYICATEKYAAKRGVVHIEHGNMPLWAMADPALFWLASDEFERTNGTVYRELEVSLPRELPLTQQIELAKQLAEEACGNQHAFSFAIHQTKASDGGMNPHLHLQFSERIDDGHERDQKHYFKRADKKNPERGGCLKERGWQAQSKGEASKAGYKSQSSEKLLAIREIWQNICNQALDEFGVIASIDCRSHAERGIRLTPQPKIGMKSWYLQKSREKITIDPETKEKTVKIVPGEENERFKRWREVVQANAPIICDMDKLELQSLQEHQASLLLDKECISAELSTLKMEEPVVRSQDDVILKLLPDSRSGKEHLDAIEQNRNNLDEAHNRYSEYYQTMNSPMSWSTIITKLACWWNHSSSKAETSYLRDAEKKHERSKSRYEKLTHRALKSPNMIDKAYKALAPDRDRVQKWKESIELLERRISHTEGSLQSTDESLERLNLRIINMNPAAMTIPEPAGERPSPP